MKPRILLAFCGLAGALLLAGCPPTYPNCRTTDDCNAEGHTGVCVDGTCEECGVDGDCASGFKCERATHKCVPAAECQTNFDCTGGRVCKDGKCTPCTADAECGPNATCENGACRPKAECNTDADCPADRICLDGRCNPKPQGLKCDIGPVRFGFNEYALTDTTKQSLQTLANCLNKTQAGARVTIEGHADERGTEEYNMSLGEKRANAVKKYLVNLGVKGDRLRTVSYGEERPSSSGHDEGSWSANRRAEFVVTGG